MRKSIFRSFAIFAGLNFAIWINPAVRGADKKAVEKKQNATYKVKKIENVRYFNGAKADATAHKLDLYVPVAKEDFPLIFYVHGGAWQLGHKNQLGMPHKLGHSFARRGIGFVSINHRLYPKVKHPEHIRDVARAFAWTHKHIAKYGGNADEIFVCGHSAGGHLIALLATNERYLKEQGLSLECIRGAIPISGVFHITGQKFFKNIFGEERQQLRDASPIKNVDDDVPPFLVLYAESDLPNCGRPWARAFFKNLKNAGALVQIQELENRNHLTILWNATRDNDPVNQAIFDFVVSRAGQQRVAARGTNGAEERRGLLSAERKDK